MMLTSVLIVTWNSQETISACLASIPSECEIVVVDNASRDGTVATIRAEFPEVRILEAPENLGFGAACNLGFSESHGERILLLNPDAALESGALKAMEDVLMRFPKCGALGPRIVGKAGGLEASWGEEIGFFREWQRRGESRRLQAPDVPPEPTPVDWVSGACILLRREAWLQVEGFDARYFLYFEDLDLCKRLRHAGWSVYIAPDATVRHIRGHSSDQNADRVEVWYRASQVHYYAQHRPLPERWALRAYLLLKYGVRGLKGSTASWNVIKLLLGGPAQAR